MGERIQVGDRFGFLTVLKTGIPGIGGSGRLALCRCDCGTERYYSARYLRLGRHKSCGCVARGEGGLDSPRYAYQRAYIGCRVGSWTVIDILPRPLRTRQRLLCRCDCGTERAQYAHKLIGYKTLSCGCQGKRAPA